jgi:predicted ArsR family transcriptional regulator
MSEPEYIQTNQPNKFTEVAGTNPNKLYSLAASGRIAQQRRIGKFSQQLYTPTPSFNHEEIVNQMFEQARNKANSDKLNEIKALKKKRKDSF